MALDESTNFALQNLGSLNKNFEDALSPLNNFAARNVQLAVAKQQMQQDQANKIAILQQQEDAENQRQARALTSQFQIAKLQEDSAMNRGLGIAKFQAGHEDAVRLKQQADAIRANPQARRVPGLQMSSYSDTPDGNQALISEFTKQTSDPQVLQTMDVGEAKGLSDEVKTIIGRLNTNTPGSAQSKAAVLNFLGTPGVTDLLIKKGRLTAQDIQSIAASGDASKVVDAIQKTAQAAYTPWGERDYLTQLIPAWNQAMSSAGATTSPSQMVDAGQLKGLLDMRDKVLGRGNIFQGPAFQQALGDAAPPATKLPPPPATTGIQTPTSGAQTASYSQNPFGAPPAPAPSDKTGLAALFASSPATTARINANNAVTQLGNLGAAFVPQKLASDPATEYAIRKSMLDSERTTQAVGAGVTSAIPFIQNFQPTYDAYNQSNDEAKLQTLVQGLYSPTAKP